MSTPITHSQENPLEIITIGKDSTGKEMYKVKNPILEKQYTFFSTNDVLLGNPLSNIAVGFIYTWKADTPPPHIQELFCTCSNYAAITGYWRTTNGGKYVISNILQNPNINKLIICIFDQEDNGHNLINAISCFWKNGITSDGKIIDSIASNPRFEGITLEAANRIRKQVDCVIIQHATKQSIQEVLHACIQEPENKVPLSKLIQNTITTSKINTDKQIQPIITSIPQGLELYDSGARYLEPYTVQFNHVSLQAVEQMGNNKKHGNSITAKTLDHAFSAAVQDVYCNGTQLYDQRNILIKEERSLSIVIQNPLENVPSHFEETFLQKYTEQFLRGGHTGEFAYTYHERIFKKWGNQVERLITLLQKNHNTRRGLITLWDPEHDLESQTPPCLDFIWFCIREKKLECHVMFRSHHLATTTVDGKIIPGEGAFIPNIYAIAHLQKEIAQQLHIETGVVIITDFSAHIYITPK